MKNNSALLVFALIFSLLGAAATVGAQEPPPQVQVVPPQLLPANQLDNLVAPIALYPDPLLGQILAASTYPIEVVEASQWLQRHRNLRGQALLDAAKQQPWDPSIQALVAVPDALSKLNQDIQWTTDLGNAFLAQEADVMNAVQRMRERAQVNGHLASTPQQTVTTQEQGGQQAIVIQPASPEVIYVPTYDPFYVWGPPAYGYYPPLYYPTFGFGFGIGYDLGFCFLDWGGWGLWGWGPNWFGHGLFVNNYFFHNYGFRHHWGGDFRGRTAWVHDPDHRMHVPYANAQVGARFGGRWTDFRNSYRTGSGIRNSSLPYANRSENRFAGRNLEQGYRSSSPQAQHYQNAPRQQYYSSQQRQSSSHQYSAAPQVQRSQSRTLPIYRPSQQYSSESQRYREGPRVVPFGNQRQQSYQAPQQYRSAQQTFSAPRVQQSQSWSQPRFQSSQQFRSAPQISGSRFSSGSFSRGGGSFSSGSRGGGGGFSGGGGSHHR